MNINALSKGLVLAAVISVTGTTTTHAQTAENTAQSRPPVNVVVQSGDSLTKIANDHATTYVRLYDANTEIAHPDVIHPGQNVRIPHAEEQLPNRPLPTPPVVQQAPQQVSDSQPSRAVMAAPAAPVSTVSGDVWAQLAACESGGNASINTGSGYYGAYQFAPSTWRSVGGAGLPHQASLEEQTARAQALQARSGWGQWPACSAKLGLR